MIPQNTRLARGFEGLIKAGITVVRGEREEIQTISTHGKENP
jgi:hypothetical protein